MKLIFHGAAKEVGKSCIELQTKTGSVLLDAGVKLGLQTEYPAVPQDIRQIDAVVVTHAHLDHAAGLPYMHSKGLDCPIYMTAETRDLAKLLIKDFVHVESLDKTPSYSKADIEAVFNAMQVKKFRERFSVKDAEVTFFDAGHIPGSAIAVIEAEGKRIAYTGDTNVMPTRLMNGADLNLGMIDILIMETTYGNREHPDRKATEQDLISHIRKTLARGGNAYVPVFGVGRAQEIIMMLTEQEWDVPIYLDGMSEKVTDLIIKQKACRDLGALTRARDKVIYIKGRHDRDRALQGQGIFVTTSGMLTGGPIMQCLRESYNDPNSSFLLTGYVVEGTNGRTLLEEGTVIIDDKKVKVTAEYKQFDFSAHAGLSELRELVKKVNPKTIILVHGDEKAMKAFAEEQKAKHRIIVPDLGDEVTI